MIVKAKVMENGLLQVTSPELKVGSELMIETRDDQISESATGKWSDVEKIAEQIDHLDFPRRTHEEIIHDLHEMRG